MKLCWATQRTAVSDGDGAHEDAREVFQILGYKNENGEKHLYVA